MSELTFGDCVVAAAGNDEFVENWMRLRGVKLARSPIDRMVDAATGHGDTIAMMFLADVHELIWSRMGANHE